MPLHTRGRRPGILFSGKMQKVIAGDEVRPPRCRKATMHGT
jgi:hypothetical protein